MDTSRDPADGGAPGGMNALIEGLQSLNYSSSGQISVEHEPSIIGTLAPC